ncbi:flagellar basal body-associated FliL family protein [Rhodoblastus sp.]|uniref:flagellar basal body-associated FliL family protein n=1 Tax=Rhodoblastus sp. TaxID=1962975 RepID=UPI002614FBD3|nr:flagellar basal body-associated FliL family protein [Rhodoblastus sp.]
MAGKNGASAEAAKRAGGMSLAQNATAFVVATVIAAGIGGFQGYQGPRPEASAGLAQSGAKVPEGSANAPMADLGAIDLAPVVTNLAAPSDVWIRIEATLLFVGKAPPHGEALAGEISGDILAYMRTMTLQQIQGVAGLQHLRQDLSERAAIRSDGRVKELIIKSLVVQ